MGIPLDVIMLTGQSNAVGRGYNDGNYLANLPRIEYPLGSYFMPSKNADNGQQSDNGAPEGSIRSAFVNRWRQQTRRAVACWKYAVGGTSLFADAQPPGGVGQNQWWEPTVKPTLFDTAVSRFNSYTPQMYGLGYEPVVRGMIWIQGENEAEFWVNDWPTQQQALIDRYCQGVIDLAAAYRTQLGFPNLPMYVPYLGSHSNPVFVPCYTNIRTAQQQAANRDPLIRICFTRTPAFWTDVPSKTQDGVHYTQTGYNEMGSAIADFIINDLSVPLATTAVPAVPGVLSGLTSAVGPDITDAVSLAMWQPTGGPA